MAFNEESVINAIATQERTITGVTASFGFAANPDMLSTDQLPAVVHYVPTFTAERWGHHNLWRNVIFVRSILYVTPRDLQGGKLKFLENKALPFATRFRAKFQTSDVINTLLSECSSITCWLESGIYGAGGEELQHNGIPYVGWVFQYRFQSADAGGS